MESYGSRTLKEFDTFDPIRNLWRNVLIVAISDAIKIKNNIIKFKEFYEKNSENFEICLSGTGSSMFIKYDNHLEREKILKIIPANWRFFLAKPLQYSPLKSLDSNGV